MASRDNTSKKRAFWENVFIFEQVRKKFSISITVNQKRRKIGLLVELYSYFEKLNKKSSIKNVEKDIIFVESKMVKGKY